MVTEGYYKLTKDGNDNIIGVDYSRHFCDGFTKITIDNENEYLSALLVKERNEKIGIIKIKKMNKILKKLAASDNTFDAQEQAKIDSINNATTKEDIEAVDDNFEDEV